MSNWWSPIACAAVALFGAEGGAECAAQQAQEEVPRVQAPVQAPRAQAQQAAGPPAPPAPPRPAFEAPQVALERGAHACVGLLYDALRGTVSGEHSEYSSWHAAQPSARTFWTASVEKGTNRAAFVSVTPVGDRRCDASTVRVSWAAVSCRTAVAAAQAVRPEVSAPVAVGEATLINRDATGRASLFLPAGAGCITIQMAALYGQ